MSQTMSPQDTYCNVIIKNSRLQTTDFSREEEEIGRGEIVNDYFVFAIVYLYI